MSEQKGKVSADGLNLWSEGLGKSSDPAILLISGAGAPAMFWTNEFCRIFTDSGYFIIRYDHRDQGMSSGVDFEKNSYTVKNLAGDAAAVLQHYKIKSAHIIGHSMGGAVAQILAIYHPEKVLSITSMCVGIVGKGCQPPQEVMDVLLENKPSGEFERDLPGFMRSWEILNGDFEVDEEMATEYTKDLYERSIHPVGVAWNHIKCQQNVSEFSQDLKKIKVPSLFIAGDKDPLMPPGQVKINSETIANSKFVVIPGMGHMFFNRGVLGKVAKIILQHLRSTNS